MLYTKKKKKKKKEKKTKFDIRHKSTPQFPQHLGVLSHKPDYHKTPFPLCNEVVLYSKTNLISSISSIFGGYPTNWTTTKLHFPSLIMTPCYIPKTNFDKSQPKPQPPTLGAISHTRLPQNSNSFSPLIMTPCYILKRTSTKVNFLNPHQHRGGGGLSQNRTTTKLHHFDRNLPDSIIIDWISLYSHPIPPKVIVAKVGLSHIEYHKTQSFWNNDFSEPFK